jgi:hypothetical protein
MLTLIRGNKMWELVWTTRTVPFFHLHFDTPLYYYNMENFYSLSFHNYSIPSDHCTTDLGFSA